MKKTKKCAYCGKEIQEGVVFNENNMCYECLSNKLETLEDIAYYGELIKSGKMYDFVCEEEKEQEDLPKIQVIALSLDYNTKLLREMIEEKCSYINPEMNLHPVEQIKFCEVILNSKEDIVIATYSAFILEFFELINRTNKEIYLLTKENIIALNEKNRSDFYIALSDEAYKMLDKIKLENFYLK
jgi:hypothetical protein